MRSRWIRWVPFHVQSQVVGMDAAQQWDYHANEGRDGLRLGQQWIWKSHSDRGSNSGKANSMKLRAQAGTATRHFNG